MALAGVLRIYIYLSIVTIHENQDQYCPAGLFSTFPSSIKLHELPVYRFHCCEEFLGWWSDAHPKLRNLHKAQRTPCQPTPGSQTGKLTSSVSASNVAYPMPVFAPIHLSLSRIQAFFSAATPSVASATRNGHSSVYARMATPGAGLSSGPRGPMTL